MSATLVRYWLVPHRARRWPRSARWAGAGALVAASAAMAYVPLRVWRPHHAWGGFDALIVEPLLNLFLIAVSVGMLFAGAVTIAQERERATWESLVLTPLGVPAIVRTKLTACTLRWAATVTLAVPFWLCWGYEVLEVNSTGPMRSDDAVSSGFAALRTVLYLAWLGVRIVGHAVPMVAIGLAVSARSRRTRTALGTVAGIAFAYGVLVWLVAATAPYVAAMHLPAWVREAWDGPFGAILRWPAAANDWMDFPDGALVSARWARDAAADVTWMAFVPWCGYRLAVRACRRIGTL